VQLNAQIRIFLTRFLLKIFIIGKNYLVPLALKNLLGEIME